MVVVQNFDPLDHEIDFYECGSRLPEPVQSSPSKRSDWGVVRDQLHSLSLISRVARAFEENSRETRRAQLVFQVAVVLVCGCLSNLPNEVILKSDKSGMAVVVLANYLFAVVVSVLSGGSKIASAPQIPVATHAALVVAGFIYQKLQVSSFTVGLTMPKALLVKNGSLICQMLVGVMVIKERYTVKQLFAAVLVTVGISCSVAQPSTAAQLNNGELLGVVMLASGMFCRALGNALSQRAFRLYGRQYHEVLFWQHLAGLPLVLLDWRSLVQQALHWTTVMWLALLSSMVLNYVVTKACAVLTGLSSSVTLNLVLTFQRFASIIISAAVIHAPPYPPVSIWIGAFLVVVGCCWFVVTPKQPSPSLPKLNSSLNKSVNDELRPNKAMERLESGGLTGGKLEA